MIPHQFEKMLNELGFEQRRSTLASVLPAVGIFAAGALVGGLLGVLFAPSSGKELRSDIRTKLDEKLPVRGGARDGTTTAGA